MKSWFCFLLVLLCAFMLLTACRMRAPESPELSPAETERSNAEITSFSYSGSGSYISANFCYALDKDEDSGGYTAELQLNAGNVEHTLPAEQAFMNELQEIILKHDLWKWNGFHRSAKRVLDGSGFSLSVTFADGSSINASGYHQFPDGFSDASGDIKALFDELMKKHGIETDF